MIWLRTRSEWRRRGPALCALTLLVALTGTVVLTAVAGARRTRSAIDRVDRAAAVPDGYAVLDGSWSIARAKAITQLPGVATGKRMALMGLLSRTGFAVAASPVDPGVGSELLVSRLLRGRRANPRAPLEMALAETTARAYGVDVGGVIELASPSAAQWECLDGPPSPSPSPLCARTAKALNREEIDLSQLDGPHFRMQVVGITRSLFEVGASSHAVFYNLLTPAFYEKYGSTVQSNAMAMVLYRPGVTDAQFEAGLVRAVGRDHIVDFNTFTSTIDALRSTAGVLANGLLAFAAVAALVGLVLISQVVARSAQRGTDEREILGVFGVTRAGRILDAAAPLIPVAIAGSALAVVGAWIASRWTPIGTARRALLSSGTDFDVPVLLGGAVALALVVFAMSVAGAMWVERNRTASESARSGLSSRVVVGGVTATIAARMVTQPGRGPRAIPLRSAVAGIALALAGVVGVSVFAGSLHRLTTDPVRQGWGWDALVLGVTTDEIATAQNADEGLAQAEARLVANPDTRAVTEVWMEYQPRVDGHTVPGFAERFIEGDRGFVIVNGRHPNSSDEVALGAKTLRRSRIAIGDRVDVDGKQFRVVGTALFPTSAASAYALADGVLLTDGGRDRLGLGSENPEFAVSFRPGVDRAAAAARLSVLNNGEVPGGPSAHAEVEQLGQLDRLPIVLAGLLGLIAILAVGQLIVLAVRRRGRDLAVLRTLGCTPAQTKRIVAWEATMLAFAGTLIGVPVGIVLGRLVWSRIANAYGIQNDSAWPWEAMVLVLGATLVLAIAIAWWPGRRAAHRPIVDALRTE